MACSNARANKTLYIYIYIFFLQIGEDPFTRVERERREKVKQNRRSEAQNVKEAIKQGAVPSSVKLATKLDPKASRGQITKGRALKGDIQNASYLAGVSTASMGKFDKRLKGEKGERKLPGFRKKHLPVDGGGVESEMVSKVMGKVVRCDAAMVSNIAA
jgi:regulator of ribosome biosynthesis